MPNNRWNLGFGDMKGKDWTDDVISDNNDLRKVLQTVANAVYAFIKIYPNHEIVIIPLEHQRKLLYNRVFQQRWHEIETVFIVKGVILNSIDPKFEDYYPKKIYDYFILKRK